MDSSVHNTVEERIQSIRDKWFLIDPGFFMILCTHAIEYNKGIGCPIACGGGKIYINPDAFEKKSNVFLEDALKLEIIRIILKHPYQRQLPNRVKMYLASNMTVSNNFDFAEMKVIKSREFFNTYEYDRESMEMIYDNIFLPEQSSSDADSADGVGSDSTTSTSSSKSKSKGKQSKSKSRSQNNGSGQNGSGQRDINNLDDACSSMDDAFNRSQFWREDEMRIIEMNNLIDKIDSSNSWGSIPGSTVDEIKKSIESKFDYKAMFQQFRSTVLSSNRTLTRMKPNRRFGYDAAGSKRNFTTKILVAVDTSGSILDDELSLVFDFINKFFKYGVTQIDTIQFDTQIASDSLHKLTKKMKTYKVSGRGGTDFNCVFKYVQQDKNFYDGVIIVTDGHASVPDDKWLRNNFKDTRYLWCLNNESRWKSFKKDEGFSKFGKCTFVDKK